MFQTCDSHSSVHFGRLLVLCVSALLAGRALAGTTLYVDDDAPNDPGPGDNTVSDPLEDGSLDRPFDAIQEAIDAAVDADEIIVAPGTYNEFINFLGKAIELRSSRGPDVTTIDAGGLGLVSVATCENGAGPDTLLEGFTITGGTGTPFGSQKYGGGMYNSDSSPTVANCIFAGNSAGVVFGCGGGMYNGNSDPIVTNCTFIENSNRAMCNVYSNPTVIDCTFENNSAYSAGGGMYNSHSSPTVTKCTFSGNTSGVLAGGGMFNFSSSPTVTNCTSWCTACRSGGEPIVGEFDQTDSLFPTKCEVPLGADGSANEYGGGLGVDRFLRHSPLAG